MTFLKINEMSHYYFLDHHYTKAIDSISLSISQGEFVSIIGPSGCGKSTLLSIIARLLHHTEGDIEIRGEPLHQSTVNIGYMLQEDYLFPWKTIMNNILLGPKIQQTLNDEVKEEAWKLLKNVNLTHTAEDYPSSLSGGMRQRIALIRTLITNPELLLFDEPFSALDYVTKLKLENTVHTLMKKYNKTAILVTHDLGEAISMSDRIFLMKSSPGKIAKVFNIPEKLRNIEPFYVRRHPEYQQLFDSIWQHLDDEITIEVGDMLTNET